MSARNLVQSMRADGGRPPRRTGAIDLALIACAFVGILALGWFAAGRYIVTPPVAQRLVAASTTPAPTGTEMAAAAWTDADEKRCQVSARDTADDYRSAKVTVTNTSIAEGYPPLATMVHCRLAKKQVRFCDPVQRMALVEMVNDYLGRLDLLTVGLAVQGAPMKMMGGLVGGEAEAGNDVYEVMKNETFAFMQPYNDKIVADLRKLASNGVITAADFGGFMGMGVPDRIVSILKGVNVETPICS